MKALRFTTGGFLLILALAGFVLAAVARPAPQIGSRLHSAIPAGYNVIMLKPSGETLSLMGLVECPEIEGAQHVSEGLKAHVVSARGETIHEFPQHFSFRVTASLRKFLLEGPLATAVISEDPREMLLDLRFRIRAYHGLESREIAPASVEMIGMPADVAYNERVYRITVNAGNLPITSRLVLEVLSPQGEPLTHFPFTLL